MAEKKTLGSGLDSLFEDNDTNADSKMMLKISEIEQNHLQPRKHFDDAAIQNLADSIQEFGMLEPILVRPYEGAYQIVAGERRWRAARMLGMSEVPVIIREMDDKETMQISLIENLQRENLNPLEEAMGYRDLMQDYDMTQEEVAKIAGKSRAAIANTVRILNLPDNILDWIEEGKISSGHARALLAFESAERMQKYAKKAAEGKLTVRQLEKLAKEEDEPKEKTVKNVDSYFTEMEVSLTDCLGRRVKVDMGKKSGVLILEFYDKEDLSALAKALTEGKDIMEVEK